MIPLIPSPFFALRNKLEGPDLTSLPLGQDTLFLQQLLDLAFNKVTHFIELCWLHVLRVSDLPVHEPEPSEEYHHHYHYYYWLTLGWC